ncbi:AAA family ATPase [Wangella sp. NEAU-J3]|nr:AAA family ATPase [Jidongwangia harbinensis]MCA2212374.1 AAA family ATPase [Jidongwangia harbinensis]
MDGTETGWGRPAEPAPRWRALLDRARHASRTAEEAEEDALAEADRAPESRRPNAPQPPPMRPVNPLERRSWAAEPPPRTAPEPRPEPRPFNPLDRRPVNPLDRRATRNGGEPRPAPPADPRPVNPLEARRQSRIAEGFQGRPEPYPGRAEPEQPHSFFSPSTRQPQPPPAPNRMPPGDTYRAAASVGSAPVLPPAPAAPTSPAAARIEWRQARPEQELDRAVAVMRRKLGKPRVLAFANPKGGVHKTTATVLAAATIGSVRGRGVVAWDDNELRGTLGLRAGSARHARTIRHLVADLMQIENLHGDGLLHALDDYLRHASDGSYDVLAGEENPRFAQRLDQSTVRRVMDLLRRTHDVICVDTGNNVESVNWQTVMKAADQLVITTVPREDAAFTADWMLDLLNETGMDDLVANAVTLISCPSPGKLPLLDDLTKHFATRTRAVAVVPYDPALEVGSSIEYAELQPETRSAWLRAASMMIEPFAE